MGLTKVTYCTKEDLLPKLEVDQTSIIFGRNLAKQKKSKSETKKKPKNICGN